MSIGMFVVLIIAWSVFGFVLGNKITDSDTNRWRNSRCNRRCKFCKHYFREFSDSKGTCRAKDRPVYGRSRRPFCKVFQIKPFYEEEEK